MLVPLAGCAARPNTPSLLPRGIENQSEAVQPRRAAPVEADPAINARIEQAEKSLAATQRTFDAYAARAETLVAAARGQPAGSEAWLNAQAAIADLDVLRAQSSLEATDLERIAMDRAAAGKPPYPGLDDSYRAAQSHYEAQAKTIMALAVQLPTAPATP
ncbi:hypothetical protein [Sphingomonas sp.]|uniref:hypothetical protein n=1 Tax=Sphingomonas sp. TaxID=28214 RepID=UPI001D3333EC|nr:hypothetical protein [Sphingomonas sp.]MBX9797724.1 hypothetical protein [Sphingomonas sp.]